jgi:hypothetical protein
MRKSVWSLPFDASTDFVTRRELLAGDTSLSPGDAVPESAFSPRRLRQLFEMRHIVHRVTWDALNEGISRFETDPFAPAEVAEPVAEPVAGEPETATPANAPGLPGLPGAAPENTAPVVAPESEPDIDVLRAEAKALNVDFDGRWGVKRLQAEIEKAKATNGESA